MASSRSWWPRRRLLFHRRISKFKNRFRKKSHETNVCIIILLHFFLMCSMHIYPFVSLISMVYRLLLGEYFSIVSDSRSTGSWLLSGARSDFKEMDRCLRTGLTMKGGVSEGSSMGCVNVGSLRYTKT